LKFHLIAIGGTGMGALAGLLKSAGHEVRGSDVAVYPPMSEQLAALGIEVYQGFAPANLAWGPDAVVVGNVCGRDHVEVVEAQRLGLALRSMPDVLSAEFLASKKSLVVAGTHGKTTTSALLARILQVAGRDPGFFVGGVPLDFGHGWRAGTGGEFVVEGDEYDTAFFDKGSKFLHYRPHIVVLTSIELDHVDIFSSMEDVREAFRKLVRLIPADGLLIANAQSDEVLAIARAEARCPVQTYALAGARTTESQQMMLAHWVTANAEDLKGGRSRFEVYKDSTLFGRFESLLVGDHNVGNALGAIAAAAAAGLSADDIRKGLAQFSGVKRRQELRGIAQGVYVIDDYAHHPTAITETLKGLRRRFPGRRLLAAFEPRTATSRRKTFQREFADAFKHADALVVGRPFDQSKIPESERFDPQRLALDVHQGGVKASYLPETADIVRHLTEEAHPGDVVVVFSSGAFDGLHERLLAELGDAVTPANFADMTEVHALLDTVGLPHSDIADRQHGDFLVLHNETGFVGCVGLEVYGEDAILRSLAVKKESRSSGYGWMLADTIINVARHRGVRRVYLLTETASDFFAAKFGFHVVVPSTISPGVIQSSVFRERPETAVAMRLDL
jgi:UDP-N-acetylmuramate: L-alanyl-gamma-D-glutamyl-meso-diaminopimelate ligase